MTPIHGKVLYDFGSTISVNSLLYIACRFFFPGQTLSRQFWMDGQRVMALDKMLDQRVKAYPSLSEKLLKSIDSSKVDHRLAQISTDIIEEVGNCFIGYI